MGGKYHEITFEEEWASLTKQDPDFLVANHKKDLV